MPAFKGNDQNSPTDNAEVCYETFASQEEVYLEEVEEELRVSLASDDPPPPRDSGGILAENHGESTELRGKEIRDRSK